MPDARKTIGFFGGTFDPVHNGHLAIAESFLDSKFIDELWVFLSPSPPHKKQHRFAPFPKRLEMLKAAFNPMKDVLVSDLELSLSEPSYTVHTISYLKNTYPDYTFYLCMGKDSFLSFTNWHKWQEILDQAELLVADRPINASPDPQQKLSKHTHFVDHEAVAISSSQVRKNIQEQTSVSHLIPAAVFDIIQRDHLYTKT